MPPSAAWSLGIVAASALFFPVASSSSEAGFLALPLTKHNAPGPRGLAERQTSQPLTFGAAEETYLVDVAIGNPKQKVQLAVDISYEQTWVMSGCDSSALTDVELEQCIQAGTYDSTASKTAHYLHDGVDVSGIEHERHADHDDFTIGDYGTLKDISIHTATSDTAYYGNLGLDFGRGVNTVHPAIMDHLVEQNVIASKSFALTLGGDENPTGSLVFGGIDTKKFAGPLTKLPINKPRSNTLSDSEYHYWMRTESAKLDDAAGNVTTVPGFYFLPYSIGERNYLPSDVGGAIASAFGVNDPIPEGTSYIVDCDLVDSVNGSLALDFPGGLSVSIPYRELVTRRGLSGDVLDKCYVMCQPRREDDDRESVWELGHPFLRRVYAVFDQDERAIWLANYQDCGSEVVKFEGGDDVRGQCGGGSGSGGSESSSGGTQDGADNGSAGARASVAMGAVVFAAAMSPFGL